MKNKKPVPRNRCLNSPIHLIILVCILAAIPGISYGEAPDSKSPWHIVADNLEYNDKTSTYKAEGNVIITRDDNKIESDFVEYNSKNMTAYAKGHVVVSSLDDTSSADKMELDLNSKKGILYNGTVFIKSNHLYIKGDKIEKTGDKTYTADKVSITTCDGDSPDWKITGRDLKVTIEGYGTVFHSAFWAKKVPVLYSPFFLFPVKLERQTGLLSPEITISSKRKGYEYFQPFFWAISDNTDATFYLRHMEERGNLFGSEFRYILNADSKGTIMIDYLKDKKTDDGIMVDGTMESVENWGYGGDTLLRKNKDRYWFRMKHNQLLPQNVSMKINADIVSDQDYLNEFYDMKNGYKKTEAYFTKEFGSDLDTEDTLIRKNSIQLNKNWTMYSINTGFHWNDNIIARKDETDDYTLQNLPQVSFIASKQKISGTPVYFSLDSEYKYFYRADTSASKYNGHRLDVLPRFYFPYKCKNWFSLEPSIGLRETIWNIDENLGPETTTDPATGIISTLVSEDAKKIAGAHDRYIYDVNVGLSTDFYKIFNVNIGSIDKIKHSVTPKLTYNYIPEIDQTDYPKFDGVDSIAKTNTVTFSIANYLTSRSLLTTTEKPSYTYNSFCRLNISQTYDINEEKATEPEDWRNSTSKEVFLPLCVEFDITPKKYFNLTSDIEWSKYEKDITVANATMSIFDYRGDSIGAEYRYTRDSIESVLAKAGINLLYNVSVYSEYEYDIKNRERIESNFGINYRAQCWNLNILYTDKVIEQKYTLTLTLTGLGDIKTNIEAEKIKDLF